MPSQAQIVDMVNLYHVARTALAAAADQSRFARMQWATAEFCKANPGISRKRAWCALSEALR